jgi:hypothetical protein
LFPKKAGCATFNQQDLARNEASFTQLLAQFVAKLLSAFEKTLLQGLQPVG